ncbi:RNA-binding domain containing protein [Gracilaria domingensis]|nr:RNA-binding domain containing protein [Gracilaria domingensis]
MAANEGGVVPEVNAQEDEPTVAAANEKIPDQQNGKEHQEQKTDPANENPDDNHEDEKPSTDLDSQVSDLNQLPTSSIQELEAMKKRLLEMEQESFPLSAESSGDQDNDANMGTKAAATTAAASAPPDNVARGGIVADDAVADADSRSIYVGNVDYSATVEELSKYFEECGTINRVTIITHKPTGAPKGYAYVEFKDQHAVQNALILNEAMFKGRQLKITAKRTNVPGLARGGRGRGRYYRGGRSSYHYGRRPRGRPRGRWVPY